MPKYIELNGIRMWYDEQGSGEPLVMLHPGGIDSSAFGPNIPAFTPSFRVFLPERRGHGHTEDGDAPYSYERMAEDTIQFLERTVGGPARLLGMSDGGIVALVTALKRPDLVKRLICAGNVFHNSGWMPGAIDPIAEPTGFMTERYRELSPDGIEHLPVVVKKLDDMRANGPKLAEKDLRKIECRTLVMCGDDDEVILEHAIAFYRGLPKGELAIVPGTSHGLLVEKPKLCNSIILDFLCNEPVQTFAPIRRANANLAAPQAIE